MRQQKVWAMAALLQIESWSFLYLVISNWMRPRAPFLKILLKASAKQYSHLTFSLSGQQIRQGFKE